MTTVLVTDLKQLEYCPRIVYYRWLFGQPAQATAKMQEGKLAQEELEKREVRRTLRRYGFEEAQRRFGVWLHDPELGLAGRLDMLLQGAEMAGVVDFKLTSGPLRSNHRLQLAAYSLLVERQLGLRVPRGFVYRIPDGKLLGVLIGPADYERVLRSLRRIREIAELEACPKPAENRKKCEDCEYANYCADVW